jgi:hypothetical protein
MRVQAERQAFRDQRRGFPSWIVVMLVLPLFLALKLASVTDWSWWWVLAPAWIPALITLVMVALGAAAFTLAKWFLMARAWARFRQLPELSLADPAIASRIEAERPARTDA